MSDGDMLKTFPSPMGNGILVKVFDPQSGQFGTTFFGQIVPPRDDSGEVKKPLPARGIVVAAGPGTYHIQADAHLPMAVKVGDEVLFFDQYAQPIELVGADGEPERLVLLGEDNVLVVVSRTGIPSEVHD